MSYYASNLGTKSVYSHHMQGRMVNDHGHTKSRIRVVHNVANGPRVDGYVDGNVVLRDVPYKAISDYLQVKAGAHHVKVNVSGTDTTIVDGQINLVPGVAYSLIVHGLITDLNSIAPLLLEDNLTCPSQGQAHVRFIHAAAGAPAVDIYGGNNRVFESVSYGQLGNPQYLPVPAGPINVSVAAANGGNGGQPNVVLGPIPLNLASGGIYTIIASGLIGNAESPLTALVSEDSKGSCIVTNM